MISLKEKKNTHSEDRYVVNVTPCGLVDLQWRLRECRCFYHPCNASSRLRRKYVRSQSLYNAEVQNWVANRKVWSFFVTVADTYSRIKRNVCHSDMSPLSDFFW